MTRNIFWTGSDYRTANYLVYDGESQVFPVVVYGAKVLNYGNFYQQTLVAIYQKLTAYNLVKFANVVYFQLLIRKLLLR